MKGLTFLGDRRTRLIELERPTPGPGEVLIEMKASGLCGSDLRRYRAPAQDLGDAAGRRVVGHEPCGVVAEVGPGVAEPTVGQRVMFHHYSGCGRCRMCRIGYTQMCEVHHEVYGSTKDGGHQDFLLAPAYACVPLREELTFEEGAAIACGTGTAYHAVKRLGLRGADTVAIFGQGPVGLSATMFAAAMGARVIAVDLVPRRLELARRLGADATVKADEVDPISALRELTSGKGPDATLDATGLPQVRAQCLEGVALWGRVCFVGEGNPTTFDVSRQIIHRQLTIYGSWTFSIQGMAETADFVVERRLPLKELITHRFSLEEGDEAYRLFDSGETGKVVIVWD